MVFGQHYDLPQALTAVLRGGTDRAKDLAAGALWQLVLNGTRVLFDECGIYDLLVIFSCWMCYCG